MPLTLSNWNDLRNRSLALAHQMDWARGLRAATALSTPLLIADFTGLTHLGWTALGGIEAIVTDAGGPYRARLGRLSVLTFGGALAVFLGTLAGNDLRWALPVTLLFCFSWTYLSVLGQPFASAGLLIQVIYACGIGDPEPSWREALLRAGFLIAGGIWATMLSLFLWPIDPYRPARAAVSKCYSALAAFLGSTAAIGRAIAISNGNTDELNAEEFEQFDRWDRTNAQHKIELRRLIELAWEAVASVRNESQAETAQGRNLIVLLETVDLALGRTVSLAEHTVALSEQTHAPDEKSAHRSITHSASLSLNHLHETANWISAFLILRLRKRHRADSHQTTLHAMLARIAADDSSNFASAHDLDSRLIAMHLAEVASNLDTAVETVVGLRLGTGTELPPKPGGPLLHPRMKQARRSWKLQSVWYQLADNWRLESLMLRHATRVAIVCGFDICLIERRHFGHGYWLLMTSIIVLQPHVSGTMRRSLQRIGGTVAGGIFAALLAIALHSQLVTGIVLFPLALLSLALLPVNYAAFAFFLTPTFVLAFLRHTGDWQLAFLRIGNTVAGAAISIAAMTVLFPSYERERIASYLRATLVANRLYLHQLIESWASLQQDSDSRPLALARRATGLALNDMEESVQRVLAENWARKASSETLLAFAAYHHRVSQTITSLATLPDEQDWKRSRPIQNLLKAIDHTLRQLEDSLSPANPANPSDPAELPRSDTSASDQPDPQSESSTHPGLRQLLRLERQAHVMQRHLETLRRESWLLRP